MSDHEASVSAPMSGGSGSSRDDRAVEDASNPSANVEVAPSLSREGPSRMPSTSVTASSSRGTLSANRPAPSLISRLSASSAPTSSAQDSSNLISATSGPSSIEVESESNSLCGAAGRKVKQPASSRLSKSSAATSVSADARSINSSNNDADFDRRSQASVNLTGATAGPSWLVHGQGGTSMQTADDGDSVVEPEQSDSETEGDADSESMGTDSKATMGALDLLKSVSAKSVEARNGTLKATSRVEATSRWSTRDKGKGKSIALSDMFAEVEDVSQDPIEAPVERTYFVFTNAGKPVYISPRISSPFGLKNRTPRRRGSLHPKDDPADKGEESGGEEEEETATTRIGVMTALMSIFTDDHGDRLRDINSSAGRITFLQRTPLLLVGITKSSREEPTFVMRAHLDMIHNQILGLLSTSQLNAMYKRKASVDLRRLLEGTDPILDALLQRLQIERSLLMGALQPCRISVDLRDELSQLLNPSSLSESRRPPDLLYVLLLFGSKIVTLLRPKKHSAHPVDMQLLINTVQGTQALREAGSESWLPLSLPKFAPQGFLHIYASVYDIAEGTDKVEVDDQPTNLTLCFVTGNRDAFPKLSQWRAEFFENISKESLRPRLRAELLASDYTAEQVGVTGLRHFIYKSRMNTQITSPTFDTSYDPGTQDFHRLMGLYDQAFQAIHGAGYSIPPASLEDELCLSLAPPPLKMHYIKTTHEAVLAWITQPFEMYITISPWLPKAAVIAAANSVAKWVKKNEASLFLLSPPVF